MADSHHRPNQRRRPQGRGGGQRSGPTPLEAATRSTRNAITRHAEGLRDDQARLACRSVLTGIVGTSRDAGSPGEVLAMVEQAMSVIESGPKRAQLPVTMRAVVEFAAQKPGRARVVLEALRLCLRHGYVLAADHVPRQARDDGAFRASALLDVLSAAASEYLDDAGFAAAAG